MSVQSRVEITCDRCFVKQLTDRDRDDNEAIVPSKWSTLKLTGGYGDNLSWVKHLCGMCTETVKKAAGVL